MNKVNLLIITGFILVGGCASLPTKDIQVKAQAGRSTGQQAALGARNLNPDQRKLQHQLRGAVQHRFHVHLLQLRSRRPVQPPQPLLALPQRSGLRPQHGHPEDDQHARFEGQCAGFTRRADAAFICGEDT